MSLKAKKFALFAMVTAATTSVAFIGIPAAVKAYEDQTLFTVKNGLIASAIGIIYMAMAIPDKKQ